MTPNRRIFRSVSVAVSGTLISMGIVSRLSGIAIPLLYWEFAVLCSGILSTAVSARLVYQVEHIHRLNEELRQTNARLKIAAETDPLTGLLNRGAFLGQVSALKEGGRTGWLVLLDIDHFKSINDRFGHDVGDEALVSVARLVAQTLRVDDIMGRLGGEEFAIYLPDAKPADASRVAERIRAHVAKMPAFHVEGRAYWLTVSLGICDDDERTLRDSLRRADLAMYRAKDKGRNQVAIAA